MSGVRFPKIAVFPCLYSSLGSTLARTGTNRRRQLVGFAKHSEALAKIGVKMFAASVDPQDKAQEVQNDVPYPVAFGVTKGQADAIGAWWEDRRAIVQPSEFILDADGKVLASTYNSGPLGRLDPEDCIKMLTRMAAAKNK